jgi:hypothetical protein
MSIRYKNHMIDPRVHDLRGLDGFTAEVYLYDLNQETETQFFVRPSVFPTREIAEQAAMQAGRHVVDQGYDTSVNPFESAA